MLPYVCLLVLIQWAEGYRRRIVVVKVLLSTRYIQLQTNISDIISVYPLVTSIVTYHIDLNATPGFYFSLQFFLTQITT